MSKLTSRQRAALSTVRAAQASRRVILKSAAALGVIALAPTISRSAFSSSGEVNWFTWEDYAPQPPQAAP